MAGLEEEFHELLLSGAESLVSGVEVVNGACIRLGNILFLLVETAWEWLQKDGRVERLASRFITLHPQVCSSALNAGRSGDNQW